MEGAPTAAAVAVTEGIVTWTAASLARASVVFVVSGLAEIGGGYLVWAHFRNGPFPGFPWRVVVGCILLATYGFLPLLQPDAAGEFGRVYAAYGGVFIVMSVGWGFAVDGVRPDLGDALGSAVCLIGIGLMLFWPRG
eukprot:CAMPEP_0194274788 /NCGR_PEP_ID=MMETSP0169-20130528/7793_1 /TAXON_ID=218684 /ORGANISM="Corethron pennatum, Strain L29A3" /LENGTH=136 /DNA_ID=CAMNT_0039018087 /DNA_START=120 /DNA_END=526 /DNA_ORIENTATION=-